MRKTNDNGLQLIREFEGTKLRVYRDAIGKPTVGTGHLVLPRDRLKVGDTITDEQAEEFLRDDLAEAEQGVEDAVGEDVTDNQFAACVSLTFNIGVTGFQKSSIANNINLGKMQKAADSFLLYNKAGKPLKVLPGLTRRRKAERALFLTPDEPIQNGEVTDGAVVATSTTTTVETAEGKTEEKTSFASSVVTSEKAKEIAGTGLSTIGNKLATGGISGGAMAAIGAFLEKAWPLLIFAAVLIILGFVTWWFIYNAKQKQKIVEGQIASDPTKKDITFGIK